MVRTKVPLVGEPESGFYRMRLVKRGPWVPVMIWWGRPVIAGEMQDRAPRWCVAINGETDHPDDDGARYPLDVWRAWPECSGEKIDAAEYAFMCKRVKWARAYAPHHPAANPYEPIDLDQLPPVTP